ncbi:MAG: acyltransferase [Paludibacteraceae bacterium]|nr:acyltransferase [Paludibacteraceae bacterium]
MNISYLIYNLFHNRFSFKMLKLELEASKKKTKLRDCSVVDAGKNNTVTLGEKGILNGIRFFMLGDNNHITIGNNALCRGTYQQPIFLNAAYGTSITIGDSILLANNTEIHTTDYHGIIDTNTNKVLNQGKDVVIGNRCWIGLRSIVLKGTNLPDDTIVGACSVVNRPFTETNTIVAGSPAKVVRTGVKVGDL